MATTAGAAAGRRHRRRHDPRDNEDDAASRLSDRFGVWAEVLGIGEDPESTLTIAGSARAVPAPDRRGREDLPGANHWKAKMFRHRSTFAVVISMGMLLVMTFLAMKRRASHERTKKAKEKGANNTIRSAAKPTVEQTEPNNVAAKVAPTVIYFEEKMSLVIPKDDEGASELIEEVSTTQPLAPTITTVTRVPSRHDAVALYATQNLRRFSLSREDSEADAEACARHCRNLKKAFAEAGIDVAEDRIVTAAIERINFRETLMVQEHREYRNYVIGSIKDAHDSEQVERRHRETMQVAKEVKNWMLKLYKVRDRSYVACGNSFFWSMVSRVLLGLAFRCHYFYREGATGMIHRFSGFFSDRCAPLPSLVGSPDDSWKAYLLSPLGGAYNYVSVATAGVSRTSCFMVQGLTWVVAGMSFLLLIKYLPQMVRKAVICTCAIVLSDVSYLFSGIWLALHGLLVGVIWWESRQFVNSHMKTSSPSEQEMNMMYKRLDDYVNISALLPPVSVILYSCLMATASRN